MTLLRSSGIGRDRRCHGNTRIHHGEPRHTDEPSTSESVDTLHVQIHVRQRVWPDLGHIRPRIGNEPVSVRHVDSWKIAGVEDRILTDNPVLVQEPGDERIEFIRSQ